MVHPVYSNAVKQSSSLANERASSVATNIDYSNLQNQQKGAGQHLPLHRLFSYEQISPTYEEGNPFVTPNATPIDEHHTGTGFDGPFSNLDLATHHAHNMENNEITHNQDTSQALHHSDVNRQTRKSQVIRKINSGFEILRPGTLDQPRQSNDFTELREVSETGRLRQAKRLQRRSRASS